MPGMRFIEMGVAIGMRMAHQMKVGPGRMTCWRMLVPVGMRHRIPKNQKGQQNEREDLVQASTPLGYSQYTAKIKFVPSAFIV